jgi:hypothetical protein
MQKVGWEDIFKPPIGNESLHEIINDNGVRLVNCATSKNVIFKITMFRRRNIHKYIWTYPDKETHNQTDHVLVQTKEVFKYSSHPSLQKTLLW